MRENVGQVRGVLAERVVVSTTLDPYLPLTALATYAGLSVRKLREYLEGLTLRCPPTRWAAPGQAEDAVAPTTAADPRSCVRHDRPRWNRGRR
jgi:hypothetical protein